MSRMLPALPEAMAGRVRMEQVQSILRMTPVMMGANIMIAILVAFAGQGSARADDLTIWACAAGSPRSAAGARTRPFPPMACAA